MLTLALYFFPFFNMIQPNNVEGDYNTGIDYGTIDDTQTQSPFATSGPNEVIFYLHSHILLKSSVRCFGKCEPGRFYPRKYLVWNNKDTTIQMNQCVFWLTMILVCGRTDGQGKFFKKVSQLNLFYSMRPYGLSIVCSAYCTVCYYYD